MKDTRRTSGGTHAQRRPQASDPRRWQLDSRYALAALNRSYVAGVQLLERRSRAKGAFGASDL
jgi:hypothetical protein